MTHPPLSSRHVTSAHCSHLRHKGMYVMSDDSAELMAEREEISATAFWCVCTQRPFGPDGLPVSARDCVQGRTCCEH
jgi:hypothetical protein